MVKRYISDISSIGSAVDDGWVVSYADYAALEAKVAELEKDAARYRWLRDSDDFEEVIEALSLGSDDSIDRAMNCEA